MAKAEWGSKRICPSCGARYYDLMKPQGEIACPRCGTQFDPEAFLKTRRARVVATAEKEVVAPVPAEAEVVDGEEVEPAEEGEEAAAEGEGAEEEEIEDASELGEDDDDMAEVIENVEEEDER